MDNQRLFKDTTATRKIFSLRKRIRAVAGGTSASKTISILFWLIDYCQSSRNKLVSVVSLTYPHLLGGAMLDFENIMRDTGYWKEHRWVKSPRAVYTFETGSRIEFISVDTFGKAHGPRRDVLFVNEAPNLAYNIVDQLITRTREVIWLDWNPTNEFWFYTEMLGQRDDIDFITLTYLDNEALDENTIKEIESHKNKKQWWKVYGLGQLGEVEGKIYKDWQPIEEIPPEAKLAVKGLDFGYSMDPTALIDIYEWNGAFILDEQLYQKNLKNKAIADAILNSETDVITVADSAEPKSIDEISDEGVAIVPCQKGPDSRRNGIQIVQNQRIFYTTRSVNIKKEYDNYLWQKDRNDKVISPNIPEEGFDHAMDAIRYGIVFLKRENVKKKVNVYKPTYSGYNRRG